MSLESLLQHYGLAALFVGAGVEGETVVVGGGLLAHRGYFPLSGAMAAASAGSFVADQLFFLGGRRFRDHRWVRRVREKPAFARAIGWLERYPIGFILAFRFIYGLRTVSPVAIGTSRVEARTFLIVNIVAAIMWGVTFTTIGYLAGRRFEHLLHRFVPGTPLLLGAVGILGGVAVAAHVGRLAWRRWHGRPRR
ncbi:DedA family protein [Sphingomonas bacterium]|uniref:DedA family protein n=1 Tax=Sphingomonas bacterium TaxID=1895847 RepID=UPI0015757B38|nr:DedA family protein [Sphingomonas bacterium]